MNTPKNIFVYRLADNVTYTFGEYINAKRRVFLKGKLTSETAAKLSDIMVYYYDNNNMRRTHLTGARLPKSFVELLPTACLI